MKTKQEQIEEMRRGIYYARSKVNGIATSSDIAEALYNAGYRKIDDFEECRKCPAWSGTDCTRNPYTEGCLDDKVNLKNEIKRLEKENEQLKAKLEARLTCDFVKTAQTHAVQEFAKKLKERVGLSYDHFIGVQKVVLVEQIDEVLKEYEK